jgi:hypothetical protein
MLRRIKKKFIGLFLGHDPVRSVRQYELPDADTLVHYRYPCLRMNKSRALSIYILKNISIHSEFGFLVKHAFGKRYLLAESTEDGLEKYQSIFDKNVVRGEIVRELHFNQPVFLLNNAGSRSNYWHFIFDCLPRLLFLIQAGKRDFLILFSEELPKFAKDYVILISELFEIESVEIDLGQPIWLATDVLLPDLYRIHQEKIAVLYPTEIFSVLPELIKNNKRLRVNNSTTPDVILISRKENRRISNEQDILAEFPFLSLVILEDLSIEEQIVTFANAKVILGVHGAGFANLVFSSQTAVVGYWPIYFQDHDVADPIWLMANARRQNIVNLPGWHISGDKHQVGSLVRVDLEALRKFFIHLGYL